MHRRAHILLVFFSLIALYSCESEDKRSRMIKKGVYVFELSFAHPKISGLQDKMNSRDESILLLSVSNHSRGLNDTDSEAIAYVELISVTDVDGKPIPVNGITYEPGFKGQGSFNLMIYIDGSPADIKNLVFTDTQLTKSKIKFEI